MHHTLWNFPFNPVIARSGATKQSIQLDRHALVPRARDDKQECEIFGLGARNEVEAAQSGSVAKIGYGFPERLIQMDRPRDEGAKSRLSSRVQNRKRTPAVPSQPRYSSSSGRVGESLYQALFLFREVLAFHVEAQVLVDSIGIPARRLALRRWS